MAPKFDYDSFNFTKVNENEVLLRTENVTFLINNSPLTPWHILICPDLEKCLPQVLTGDAIRFCVKLMLSTNDRKWRIGYNSPGALASVNHLHLHLMHVKHHLYVEDVVSATFCNAMYVHHVTFSSIQKLNHLIGNLYVSDCTIRSYCLRLEDNVEDLVIKAERIIKYMCDNNVPHNVFMSFESVPNDHDTCTTLRFFIYPRARLHANKAVAPFNVAFCELSGFVPVGCKFAILCI